jgi:outer membrane lipoprotein SlyB
MTRIDRLIAATLLAVPMLGAAGCAPRETNTTYSGEDIGRTATVSYGRIVSMRPVAVHAEPTGAGALGGGALGGVAGSFIGHDNVSTNILGAIGGAVVGGLLGNAVEGQAGHGTAMEFIIREDDGQTISLVQTNEEHFQPGERILLTRGARTRIARVDI